MRYAGLMLLAIVALSACSPNNVKIDDSLKKHFDAAQVKGTFGIFNNASGDFTIYNLSRFKDSTYSPAQTFDIVNALAGLEAGVIRDEHTQLSVEGTSNDTAGNKSNTMDQAFKSSAAGFFSQMAQRLGKDTMQRVIDTLGYGSRYQKVVLKTVDSFWMDNSVKVTADEQLGLVKKLYFDQLPFQKRTMRIVKDAMVMEKNANYTLAYKSGYRASDGWIVGWIEENRHPYFFALNVEGNTGVVSPAVSMNVLKSILTQLGFLQGRM